MTQKDEDREKAKQDKVRDEKLETLKNEVKQTLTAFIKSLIFL